ncbi:hypothetical protein JD844_016660 [Phrynosoma platyrhinos]|uniref:TBC1 domain family member 7 n=1 Tax=Phrynosoma platyrhinos TaxID=52577 RepID=A0ABQ7SKT7_PHRPL|nr:hypothetical protein JD844_016660 [Phrynosoma platyrhinos]
MAEDPQRNFRSVYYEKVGFRGVEEKKSLEILLKDDRLGILPPHHESHAFVMKYRKEQYRDVYHALQVIRSINDSTPQVEVFLRIYQLESGKLPRNPSFPMPKLLEQYLSLEDSRLLTHLKSCSAMGQLPYNLWFRRCFAGCLPESSLQRVWDKVISGSCKILVFVAVEILLTFKMKLMALNSAEKIEHFLENIPQDNTDAIVSKAIELWHKHCGTPAHSV